MLIYWDIAMYNLKFLRLFDLTFRSEKDKLSFILTEVNT